MKNFKQPLRALLMIAVVSVAVALAAEETRVVVLNQGYQSSLPASSVTNLNAAKLNGSIIQSGNITSTADGTITNTFAVAFSAVPFVMVGQNGYGSGNTNTGTNNISTITTTNFIWNCQKASIPASWIAIGTP